MKLLIMPGMHYPESNEIINNLQLLPKINSSNLPYTFLDKLGKKAAVLIVNLPLQINLVKLEGKDEAECLLCGAEVYVKDMRKHVGNHLLLDLHEVEDGSLKDGIEVCQLFYSFLCCVLNLSYLQIGPDPCGWCGLDGCKTQLTINQIRNKLTSAISSSCQ